MALTPEQSAQVEQLKRFVGDALGTYTDDQLLALIEASGGSLYTVASNIWGEYAASTATLVDVSEGSSRRQLGDLFDQATKMSLYFKNLAAADIVAVASRVGTRAIVRASS